MIEKENTLPRLLPAKGISESIGLGRDFVRIEGQHGQRFLEPALRGMHRVVLGKENGIARPESRFRFVGANSRNCDVRMNRSAGRYAANSKSLLPPCGAFATVVSSCGAF